MNIEPALLNASLDDKYTIRNGRAYMTGIQALVRLPMLQRERDLSQGLNTAGFISGYRGSPLGGLDQALWRAKKHLKSHHIHFQPGINEDLAATAVWGSQQTNLFQGAQYDGVYALWYGKGPGVDRSMDVIRHANAAGTGRHGGVLLVCGDDHGAVSSTLAHQSEHNLISAMVPILNPANVQEYIDYGLIGWAMSRYAGVWVGFKAVTETVESSASVHIHPDALNIITPEDFAMPDGGLNIRLPDDRFAQEYRLQRYKGYAVLAFARANKLDRMVMDSPRPRFGIITTGKSYLDVMQALDDLGIGEEQAREIGLRVYKVGMVWPLEREGARRFAEGLEEVLVIEEKRAIIENQLKEQLYNWKESVRPRVIGKFDETGEWILPSSGDLTPAHIAKIIARRIGRFYTSPRIEERVAFIEAKERALEAKPPAINRMAYYCSGCPHNTSTKVPDGSRALAGIGCHFMVLTMNRRSDVFTQMGGEGVPWIGQAPFTNEKHVFTNLGDGTYYHSGLLAIRAAVAANVNITYKILYNDAVAMTGGQPVDGTLTVQDIAFQVYGEGVRVIRIVSDEPEKYPIGTHWPDGVKIQHRDDMDQIQKELRETPGVSIIIYDQTCAAEKRRRRKRGLMPDPDKRVFINDAVCEGCGDCSVQSNCVSVEPLETEFGRKRKINQSSCNKDFSCVKGFCPSFVTVHGGKLKKAKVEKSQKEIFAEKVAALALPEQPDLDDPYNILVTGIGGTGVVTIGAILGMASHLEGRGVSVLDQTGLAQKNGAVMSHIRIAREPDDIKAVRIVAGGADVVLGCDMMVAASGESLARIGRGHTAALINGHLTPTAHFTMNPDVDFQTEAVKAAIVEAAGDNRTEMVEATDIATALMGDAIATNMFMLGYAWQRGHVPLSLAAIEKAIELNGAAVDFNLQAFRWGRLHAVDPGFVAQAAAPAAPQVAPIAQTLDDIIERRAEFLTDYQNAAYADRYRALVERVRRAERDRAPGQSGLAEAVARYAFKLMAYKDEYEVARLYANGDFMRKIKAQFEGDFRLEFHLAPPVIAKPDPETGEIKKKTFGPWMMKAFGVLAKLKGLRGTKLDIFGYNPERKMERQLIEDYFAMVDEICAGLNGGNHGVARALAEIPEQIRGFGPVKERHLKTAKGREAELLRAFRAPAPTAQAAE